MRLPEIDAAARPDFPHPIVAALTQWYLRAAASGWVPAGWYLRDLPAQNQLSRRSGALHIEIVTHCWNYSHLLAYQLSSLAQHPPRQGLLTLTVFHASEDAATVGLLSAFGQRTIPNVTLQSVCLPPPYLFRRSIGRNRAALQTEADWIWFTDCDVFFGEGCIDGLIASLQGLGEPLVFPATEHVTGLLAESHPLIAAGRGEPRLLEPDLSLFKALPRNRATGPLQITHGDIARACGYCRDIPFYQRPARAWCKAHEDRAFRWLLRSQGQPLEVPGVYRIRHLAKGRYTGPAWQTRMRSAIRQWTLRFKEPS